MDSKVKPGGSANRGNVIDGNSTDDADIIHSTGVGSLCKTVENMPPGQAATPSDQKLEETCTRHSLSKEKLLTFSVTKKLLLFIFFIIYQMSVEL